MIAFKEQCQTTKNPGILFNEVLNYANQTNWQIILEKMENHINKISPKILSLYVKVMIINTLILSKTYLSNVFSDTHKKISQIHKKLFKYLWNNSQSEPIATKTMFLKRTRKLKPN